MNIETRLNNLEKQMAQLIASVSRDKTYNGYDIEANRQNISTTDNRVTSLGDSVSNGTWDKSKVYKVGDYAMQNDKLYICLADCVGISVTDSVYWANTDVAEELNKLKSLIKGE